MGIFSSKFAQSTQLDPLLKPIDPPPPSSVDDSNQVQQSKLVPKEPFVSSISGKKFGFSNFGDTTSGKYRSIINGNSRKP